ncbi:MAG: argininosuccinate lyase [Candidatus Obscuribacterales bacterium]|nr:argininosuccinate lyase [Candidatus Obscuribacterales bacterium]
MTSENNQSSEISANCEQVGRFWQNPRVEQLLLPHDLACSQAHVQMLGEQGIIDKQVAKTVIDGLQTILTEVKNGKSPLKSEDQDIHAGVERRLAELIGEASQAIKLAKSRNDQIATDIRLWLRDSTVEIFEHLLAVRQSLLELAKRDLSVSMPGYTHMQPAVPILLSHWWLANEARLRRDTERLLDFYGRLNTLPLGASALAGTTQPIDRKLVASYLGFADVIENSLDAVADRDYLIEFGSFAALVGIHLSQMSSDLLLWATQEFAFVKLPRAFGLRSLNMPQKRNPELLEILRSRPSQIFGRLNEFCAELKGLPFAFSQDLQECLPGLIDMVDTLKFLLELTGKLLPALRFDAERMKEAASQDLTNAANAVDYLVERDTAPDKAAKIIESIVQYCKERNKDLSDLALSEWQHFSAAFDNEIYEHVTIEGSVSARSSFGGTSLEQVSAALKRAEEFLVHDRQRLPSKFANRLLEKQMDNKQKEKQTKS